MTYKYYNRAKKPTKQISRRATIIGTVQANERGFAFIIPEDRQKYPDDFFVPRSSVCGAYHGDRVLAELTGKGDEARIIKILTRGLKRVIGTAEISRRGVLVRPDNLKHPEVRIPPALALNAKNGDKVVAQITAHKKDFITGKISEILGESGNLEAEELSLIRSYGLEEQFPPEVLKEADKVSRDFVSADGREDLRDKLIFTIDGIDTRDIDDGVSIEYADGKYTLGVHIADVSRYVKFRSELDKNAYSRGTSVYFPDRVLPMLPKALSNGACSLNEGEDRYALSCFMTFDKNGKRLNYRLCESVIKSRRKLSYPVVTAILQGDKELAEQYSDVAQSLYLMEKLCVLLEAQRDKAGEVNLGLTEAKIYVDEDGNISIPVAERTVSERLIEQFMISANEAVAEFITAHRAPCLYRIHESPDPEKAVALTEFLKALGINADFDPDDIKPAQFRDILKNAKDKPYYGIVGKVMLRSMQKAKYSDKNAGHFGLASGCYCHFTSPIRRYPDLFVHRVIKDILHKANKANAIYGGVAAEAGEHCSERERTADEAERKVDDLYKLAYMSERLGESFDATVSGVTAFGIFCELDNTIEGLLPVEDLPPDSYVFYENRFLLKGARHSYKLGDAIRVTAAACDLNKIKTIFTVAED